MTFLLGLDIWYETLIEKTFLLGLDIWYETLIEWNIKDISLRFRYVIWNINRNGIIVYIYDLKH